MKTTAESMYPPELIYAVGHVVMSAAWAEDKAGELIQLHANGSGSGHEIAAKGWATSGKQLLEAFRPIAPAGLADRLERALERRNEVVHGVFVPGGGLTMESDQTPPWASMKRRLGAKNPAGYRLDGWSLESLDALANELSAVEDLIDDEVSYAMGLKVRPGVTL